MEKTLRDAVSAFKLRRRLTPGGPDTSRLASLLDELEGMMESPGRAEARQLTAEEPITAQPLPTGQIPDPSRKEFSATN